MYYIVSIDQMFDLCLCTHTVLHACDTAGRLRVHKGGCDTILEEAS